MSPGRPAPADPEVTVVGTAVVEVRIVVVVDPDPLVAVVVVPVPVGSVEGGTGGAQVTVLSVDVDAAEGLPAPSTTAPAFKLRDTCPAVVMPVTEAVQVVPEPAIATIRVPPAGAAIT